MIKEHNYKEIIKDLNKIQKLCDKLNDKNEYKISDTIYNYTKDIEHILNMDLFALKVTNRITLN